MEIQYYYANFPTKLYYEFEDKEERNLHLLAMSLIVSWVHTKTGKVKLTIRKLAEEIGIKKSQAEKIINNFIERGYLKPVKKAINQYSKSEFLLSTYYSTFNNFDSEFSDSKSDTTLDSQTRIKSSSNPNQTDSISDSISDSKNDFTLYIYTKNETNNELYISHNQESVSTGDTPPQNFEEKNLSKENSNLKQKDNLNTKTQTLTREETCPQNQTKKSENRKKTLEKVRQVYEYKADPEEALKLWNFYLSEKLGYELTKENLTTKEKIFLKSICKKYTLEELEEYFEKLSQSEILFNLKSGWRPDLAWALNFDNIKKVSRGQYIPKQQNKGYDPYPHIKDTTDKDLLERIKKLHPIFSEDNYLLNYCKSNEEKLQFIANSIPLLPEDLAKQTIEIIPEVKDYLK